MLSAEATGAGSLAAHPSGRDPSPGQNEVVQRLEAALERIATALVRRSEAEAELNDLRDAAGGSDAALIGELRERLDQLIGRMRVAIDEAQA